MPPLPSRNPALHQAIAAGNLAEVQAALAQGANPWACWTDRKGWTDVDTLICSNTFQVQELLDTPLWDDLAQRFVDQDLLHKEPRRSGVLFRIGTRGFYTQGLTWRETEQVGWRLLGEALHRRLGSELWNTPIGRSLWAKGLFLVLISARDRNWNALEWLLDRGADPRVTVPGGLALFGYPRKGATLSDLIGQHSPEADPELERRRQALLARATQRQG